MSVTVESVFADERVTVDGVKGKRVFYLGEHGAVYGVDMVAERLEIPRCPVLAAASSVLGPRPPQVRTTSKAFREWIVEGVVGNRRLLRAVHWPALFDTNGTIRAEESLGIIMLDEFDRPAPTAEQWASAVAHLRILERYVAR